MEIKKLENSSVELTLTLESKKIEEEYAKRIKDYAKKLTLNGFRPGKAPVSLIESKYGPEIREEVTFKLMEDNLEASYKDLEQKQRPLPYCTPVLQNEESLLPFKPDTDITYSVVYDVVPEVKLPAYTGLTVEAETTKITDKEVDEEIERLRQQNAMVVAKNGAVEKGDIVTVNYVELDAEGKEVESTKRDNFTFTVGTSYNFYKIDEDIVGLNKGDKKVIEKTYSDDSGMGSDYIGKTIKLDVEVTEVKRKEVPELDDDFAQDIKDEYKSLDDLKKATKKNLEDAAASQNENAKLDALLKEISKGTEVQIPKSMVDAQLDQEWRNFVQRFGMSEADVEKLMSANGAGKDQFLETRRADVTEQLKLQLVLEQVKEEQKFEVSEDELNEQLKKYGQEITKDNPNYDAFKIYAEDDVKFEKAKNYLIENNKFKAPARKENKKEDK